MGKRLPRRRVLHRDRETAEAILRAGGAVIDLSAERDRRTSPLTYEPDWYWLVECNQFECLPDWPSREFAEILATIFPGKLPAIAETWRL